MADPLILDPGATNAGCGSCTIISSAVGPFPTTIAGIAFTADLQIDSAPGASGVVSATETGSFEIFSFNHAGSGITTDYNIYGTFQINGTGSWTGSTFIFSAVTAGTVIDLTANPGAIGPPTFVQATQGNPGVTSHNGTDFSLGQAVVTGLAGLTDATFGGVGQNQNNGTQFGASLHLNPTPGTTGPTGFFQNVNADGLNLVLGSSDSSNFVEINGALQAFGTDGCPVTTCTDLQTEYAALGQGANGSLTFDVVLPEPGSLALLGAALIGFGGLLGGRRRRKQNARVV
jgi:hypothetical protein